MAEALKPYLRGEKHIEINGKSADLSAAILIPPNIESHILRPGTPPVKSAGSPESNTANQALDVNAPAGIQYWSVSASETRLRDDIERIINRRCGAGKYLLVEWMGLRFTRSSKPQVPFASLNPKKEKGKEAISTTDIIKQWTPSGFVYLLWLAIFVIVQMLLNNTIEEKSNRIIEVLLSSVTPGELMMGKLFGIAAAGMTMVGAWMVALFGILSWKSGGTSEIAGQMLVVLRELESDSSFFDLFSAGVPDVCGLHSVHRQRL